MRPMGLLISLMLAGCAHAGAGCTRTKGLDRTPPTEVVKVVRAKGLSSWLLIDRQSCGNEISWLIIPPGTAIDSPRPPGVGRVVLYEVAEGKVEITMSE